MLLIALIFCIVISTGSIAWGYGQAGYAEFSRWLILFGVFWLASEWRKWKCFSAPAVLLVLFLAVYGVWYKFVLGLMFSGAVFGVLAWNITEFQEKLRLLPQREDKQGMTRRHLIRVGALSIGAVLIALWLGISG